MVPRQSRHTTTGCLSVGRVSVAVTVNALPAVPVVAARSFCGSAIVSQLTGSAPAGCVIDWYVSTTGGSALNGSYSLTSGTYYAESRNTTTGVTSATRASAVITINPVPAIPVAGDQVFNTVGTVAIEAYRSSRVRYQLVSYCNRWYGRTGNSHIKYRNLLRRIREFLNRVRKLFTNTCSGNG